ncbi:unnamed protein product, partial [Cladocopium goreaui]
MKTAFPEGYLVTWQGYGHCLKVTKHATPLLKAYKEAKKNQTLPQYTNAVAKYACMSKILSYLETGEGVEDGHTKAPVNFGGVLIFVDGERFPEDSLQENLLRNYPASIVVGPMPAGGLSDFFPVPAASSSFAARVRDTPIHLAQARAPGAEARPGFAAYLVTRCYPHRDRFFFLLDEAAHAAGLGRVEALSRCGNAPENRRSDRYSASYYDDAVDLYRPFRFAMVFENRLSPRYVTEKIVNAFLSGAVPIYWGTPYVMKMFNPKAFIYVNRFKSFEAAVEYILRVAVDPQLFADYAQAPILRNTTAAVWPYSWHRE